MSQLTNDEATYSGNHRELFVKDKNGREMFRPKGTKTHGGLYVMKGEAFRKACRAISRKTEAFFSNFEDGTGSRQHYALTWNGLVKQTHFNADTLNRSKAARELHKQMKHPRHEDFEKRSKSWCISRTEYLSHRLLVANDYYGAFNTCLEGKMTANPEQEREIGEYETDSVVARLSCIRNFYKSHNHDVQKFCL